MMPEFQRSKRERFGDYYHSRIYSKIAPVFARLTDYDFPLTDIITPLVFYAPEGLIISLALFVEKVLTSQDLSSPEKLTEVLKVTIGIGAITTLAMGIYGMNALRTPIDKKLGIVEKKEFSADGQLQFVIDQINQRSEVQKRSYQETANLSYVAVDKFLQKHEGYSVPTSKRVKRSNFSRALIWKYNLGGLLNPFIHEIITTSDLYPEAIAHEFAHLKGIPQERLAQFVGIASLLESGDPYLEYLGYRQRLDLLVSQFYPEWVKDKSIGQDEKLEIVFDQLRDRGLNETTITEIAELHQDNKYYQELVLSYSWLINKAAKFGLNHVPKKFRDNVPQNVENILLRFEPSLAYGFRSFILKTTGQGKFTTAYVSGPLALLEDYRQSYLSIPNLP